MSRRFRICMAKGDRESLREAKLPPPKVGPYFKREKNTLGSVTETLPAAVLTLEQNPPERMFKIYKKKLSQAGN